MPEKEKKQGCGLHKWEWNKGVSRRTWLKLRQEPNLSTGSISKEETCLELQDLRDLWDFSAYSGSELNSGCQLDRLTDDPQGSSFLICQCNFSTEDPRGAISNL